ncbi:hypothetical protein [Legionella sp.]|uniref:hypothetical protein n=1 Tax=Legionella sp. TaxID=459 RepID=UPI003C9CF54D
MRIDDDFFTDCPLPERLLHVDKVKIGWSVFLYGRDWQGKPIIAAVGNSSINHHERLLPKNLQSVNGIKKSAFYAVLYGRNQQGQPIIAATGNNWYGQLGTGDYNIKNCFVLCPLPTNLQSIEGVKISGENTFFYGRDL